MSTMTIEAGTLLQLVVMGAGVAVVWGQLREALAEMRTSGAQLREAVSELRTHRDRDQARLGTLETEAATLRVEVRQLRREVADVREAFGHAAPDSDDTPTAGTSSGKWKPIQESR